MVSPTWQRLSMRLATHSLVGMATISSRQLATNTSSNYTSNPSNTIIVYLAFVACHTQQHKQHSEQLYFTLTEPIFIPVLLVANLVLVPESECSGSRIYQSFPD